MDPISEYQKWKQQGATLRTQAKQAMESRFHELLSEAMRIAQEYHTDFGATLKPPAAVTAFRFKTSPRNKTKKPPAPKASQPDPKIMALQKRLAQTRKKLEAAKASGSPTKNLEDRIYEIEDALNLAAS